MCRIAYKTTAAHSIETVKFSPFDGVELPSGFWYELSCQVTDYLLEDGHEEEFEVWNKKQNISYPKYSLEDIPDEKKHLINDRSWYEQLKTKQRLDHHDGEFCGEMAGCFIEDCREYHPLPQLACVPIQYCPFCGVKLPPEFDQENWWEKEFKTFKWYKDHKMYEWADDYVDDDDWTAEDYERAYERIDAEREKMSELDEK